MWTGASDGPHTVAYWQTNVKGDTHTNVTIIEVSTYHEFFSISMNSNLKMITDNLLGKEQVGFQKRTSTTDASSRE